MFSERRGASQKGCTGVGGIEAQKKNPPTQTSSHKRGVYDDGKTKLIDGGLNKEKIVNAHRSAPRTPKSTARGARTVAPNQSNLETESTAPVAKVTTSNDTPAPEKVHYKLDLANTGVVLTEVTTGKRNSRMSSPGARVD